MDARLATIAFLGCALFASAPGAHAEENTLKYGVKAAYLYKIAPFVEWPAGPRGRAFEICIVGDDPFGRIIDDIVAGQRVQSRPIAIRRLTATTEPIASCEIMYVAGSSRQSVVSILASTHGMPILTVTDAEREPKPEGMIHFVEKDGNIKFAIDAGAAEQSGIRLSSKLLDLAVAVHGIAQRPRVEVR